LASISVKNAILLRWKKQVLEATAWESKWWSTFFVKTSEDQKLDMLVYIIDKYMGEKSAAQGREEHEQRQQQRQEQERQQRRQEHEHEQRQQQRRQEQEQEASREASRTAAEAYHKGRERYRGTSPRQGQQNGGRRTPRYGTNTRTRWPRDW